MAKHCNTCTCDEPVQTAKVNMQNYASVAATLGISESDLYITLCRHLTRLPPDAPKEIIINVDTWPKVSRPN